MITRFFINLHLFLLLIYFTGEYAKQQAMQQQQRGGAPSGQVAPGAVQGGVIVPPGGFSHQGLFTLFSLKLII